MLLAISEFLNPPPEFRTRSIAGEERNFIISPRCDNRAGTGDGGSDRHAVSCYHIPEHAGTVTVSIGVAEHQEGEEIDQLFNRVDKALYAAKKEGRNRKASSGRKY